MSPLMEIILEDEGVRTPKRKRSRKEREAALADFNKRQAEKKAKASNGKSAKTPATASAKSAGKSTKKPAPDPKPVKAAETPKPAVETAEIPMTEIAVNSGHTVAGGYDPKSETMRVRFARGGVYDFFGTRQKEFDDWEATFASAEINSGSHFNKAFRGRAANSRRVIEKAKDAVAA